MSRKRGNAGRLGESLLALLAIIAYYTYEKLIKYPVVASLIFGLIVSFFVIAILLILSAIRIRKANFLAKESIYRDYSPIEFEHMTADIFRLLGYKAIVTPPSGDKGIDVLLTSNENRIGVQCKRYQDIIGPAFIREFAGALEGARLSQGFFVTTSDYSEAAKEAASNSKSKISLIDGMKLGEMRNKAENKINTDLIPQHWWRVIPIWQRASLITMLFFCITLVVSVGAYIIIFSTVH